MQHYKDLDRFNNLCPVNVAAPGFDAAAHGLTAEGVQKTMHVVTADGKAYTAEQGFRLIWRALPARVSWRLMDFLLGVPGVRGVAHACYKVLSKNRYRFSGQCTTNCRVR